MLGYISPQFQTCVFATRHRIAFVVKSSFLNFFFIFIPQQGTALSFSLQGSNVPVGLGLQKSPCLRVHGSSQNYSTSFLLPWTCPYLAPKLPDLYQVEE